MKLLYAVTGAGFGGAPRNVLQLMEEAVRRGYEVALISAPERRLIKRGKELGVKVYPNSYFVRPICLRRDVPALIYTFRAIKDFDPDLIHAHSTKAGLAARIAALLLGKPVVFTAHGWGFTEGVPKHRRIITVFLERLAARFTDKIICVSEYDRNLAMKFHVGSPEQLVVVHNGVDPHAFGADSKLHARERLGLRAWNNKVVLTFIGRLSPPKDISTLLQALSRLPRSIDYRMLIVGKGELQGEIESKVVKLGLAERVYLMGEREDVAEVLFASDIFVLISEWEGLPYTIIEAMMSGLPVVASRVGGIPELVEDGVTGFLVDRRDVVGLSRKLMPLLENRKLRKSMGDAGRQKALRGYTEERMLSNVWKVYRAVMSSAS